MSGFSGPFTLEVSPDRDEQIPGDSVLSITGAPSLQCSQLLAPCFPHPHQAHSTHLELALEWPKDMSLLQEMGGMHTGSCLDVQEGGRTGHFLVAFWPLQVL